MARKLRIAMSVFFGAITLLLVVMWVRSYRWNDGFYGQLHGKLAHVISFEGDIELAMLEKIGPASLYTGRAAHSPAEVYNQMLKSLREEEDEAERWQAQHQTKQFRVNAHVAIPKLKNTVVHVPYWMPTTLAAALSEAP